jgi:DNA-directed RNA polymerase specialized sigma24 family protein
MGAAESAPTPQDFGRCSDEELLSSLQPLSKPFSEYKQKHARIARRLKNIEYPENTAQAEEKALLEHELQQIGAQAAAIATQMRAPAKELFTRHQDTPYKELRRLIRIGGLCPPRWTKETFADHCLSRAYENMLTRICGFEFRGSFDGWLSEVAKTTALDEYDRESREQNLLLESEMARERLGDSGDDSPSRSPFERGAAQSLPEHEWMKGSQTPTDPLLVAEAEREEQERARLLAEKVRGLFEKYESLSDKNAESLRFLGQHRLKSMTHDEIAVKRYGEPANDTGRKQQIDRVSQKISRNRKGLRKLCKQLYGAASLKEVSGLP